jgi:hypothetical protein
MQNEELLLVKTGGTYSYHWAWKGLVWEKFVLCRIVLTYLVSYGVTRRFLYVCKSKQVQGVGGDFEVPVHT